MDKTEYAEIKATINEIRDTQKKMSDAILGTFGKDVGLLEESRNLRRDVDRHEIELKSVVKWTTKAKIIVGGIVASIPVVWEVGKVAFTVLWNSIHQNFK